MLNDTTTGQAATTPVDPYAEFGGAALPPAPTPAPVSTAKAPADPYAEFGGATLPPASAPHGATGSWDPASPTAGMSPDLQAAYARGQHAPIVPEVEPPSRIPFQKEIGEAATGLGTGVMKGGAETIHTVGNFLNKHLGIPMPDAVLRPELAGGLEAKDAAETTGKFGEAIGEFFLGDEAVKGLSIAERWA